MDFEGASVVTYVIHRVKFFSFPLSFFSMSPTHIYSEPSGTGGRSAIIGYNGRGWFQKLFGHWTSKENIWNEMEKAGYYLDQEFNSLP